MQTAYSLRARFQPTTEWVVKQSQEMPQMTEPLPEQQKTLLIVRSPLSEDGSISIYFSSRDGRLMSQEEWWHLKELVELANRMCVKQQARSQTA